MALELPFILGTSPEHAAITLYGFMQQNVLFDAFSGRLPDMAGTPLEFLQEITTLFSMIGLLVLIFSPSLWKPKYIVSWMFLFVLVALGGSSGNEFSYNLNRAEDMRFLSTGIEGDTTACQTEEMQNGACYKIHPNEEVMQRHVPQDTIGSSLENREVFGQKKIIMHDGSDPELHILAFLPQVYLIYATNRFKSNLETALYDLNTRRFNKKKQALQTMISAQTPVPQLDLWISIFDQVCASKAGVSTAALVTSGQTGVQNVLNSELLNQKFKFGDLIPVVAKSTILESYNNNLVPPTIDIVTKNRNKSGIMEIIKEFLNKEHAKGFDDKILADSQDAIRQYTINFPETAENGFFSSIARAFGTTPTVDDTDDLVYYNDLNEDEASNSLKDHLANTILAKLEGKETYENNGEAIKKHPISQTPADLIMPKYLISRTDISTHVANGARAGGSNNTTCYNLFNKAACSLEFMSRNTDDADLPETTNTPSEPKSKFVRIDSCNKFLTELETYYRQAQQIDINDFENQLAAYTSQLAGNSPHSAYTIRIPAHVKAMSSYIKELNTMRLQCDSEAGNASGSPAGRSTPEWLACSERNIDPIVKHYAKSAINNALAQDKRNISNFYAEQYNSLTEGATGLAYSIGEGFTDLWTGPLAGLKSIGVGFQSGAYSHILPIIKNILIAFILVGTPILFLLGLLVPSWAPGVILTSIVSILFLQMTDVIMVVVQTILVAIEQPIYAIAQTTSDDATDYQAFMEVIWGMAYMSVFGITAFFMFAAGNTKQIMSQMAGLDGTVKSISKDIYTEGWNLTKKGAQISAGLATGGTMGGALGKQAASSVAGINEFASLAGSQGLGTAVNQTFGTTSGNYAILQQAHRDKATATVKKEANAKKEMGMDMATVALNRNELIEQAKDSVDAENDKLKTKREQRVLNKTKHGVETQETRTLNDVIMPNTSKILKRNKVYGAGSKKVDIRDEETGIITRQGTFSPEDKINNIYEMNKEHELNKNLSKDHNIALSGAVGYAIGDAMKNAKVSSDGLSYEFAKGTDMTSMINHARKSLDAGKTGLSSGISDDNIRAAIESAIDKGGKSISHTVGNRNLEETRNAIVKGKGTSRNESTPQPSVDPKGVEQKRVKKQTSFAKNMK